MKTTISKLRRIIRKVITEHVSDEHHEHGGSSHKEEPYEDYVKDFAGGYFEEYQFEDYLEFGMEYGYTEFELGDWWDAAGEADNKMRYQRDLKDDLESGRIDLVKNPYALD